MKAMNHFYLQFIKNNDRFQKSILFQLEKTMEIIQTGYFNIWQDKQIWQTKRKKKSIVFGSDNIPIIMF